MRLVRCSGSISTNPSWNSSNNAITAPRSGGSNGRKVTPCGSANVLGAARVVEGGLVAAPAGIAEVEVLVVDVELLGEDLPAGALVAGDDAGHGAFGVDRPGDADADQRADPEPAAARGVVDLDPAGHDGQQGARLERPRKLAERRAAQATREDVLERLALRVVCTV